MRIIEAVSDCIQRIERREVIMKEEKIIDQKHIANF